jgi:AcrR family transcriptional regulator
MDQRAEAAEKTRQRIVEATMALHSERGVLATSHKDIASRADVSVGTVYHHFPTVDDIVRACGARTHEVIPPPALETIDAQAPRAQRIASLLRELVKYYARTPWLEKLRTERHEVQALDIGITMREAAIRQLIRRAVGRALSARKMAVVEAIADPGVVNRLLKSGMSQKQVAETLTSIINPWLEGERS